MSIEILEVPICGQAVKLRLDLSHSTQRNIYEAHKAGWLYETVGVLTLSKFLRPGDVFIDVGSHVGYYSMVAAAMVGPSGKVVAFEPNEVNYQFLVENSRLNESAHVYPVRMAVGDQDGLAPFFECVDGDGGHALWDLKKSGIHPETTKQNLPPKSVQMISLDSVICKLKIWKVTAIKIDVEGAEVQVLEGAKRCLANGAVDLIIAEYCSFAMRHMGTTPARFIKAFYDLGYKGYWSLDAENFEEITFDRNSFEPYGKWFEHHERTIENLFFVSSGIVAKHFPILKA